MPCKHAGLKVQITQTKKIKVYDIFCMELIGEELSRYVTVVPICVSLMKSFKIITFLLLNKFTSNFHQLVSLVFQLLLKLR